MFHFVSAHEVNSDVELHRYPELLQEVFQWKPKPKGKKQKSQIDDTRTEISYSASTTGGDMDLETSTYVSKDLGTPSSRSSSKKRSKKSLKETSSSVHSAASASPEATESSKEVAVEASHLVTLNCPLCDDTDCILNKAAQCPLLRHDEADCTDDECCTFCGTNCKCEENKAKSLPVSGLVARDENGVAVTLLKVNGGPIEDSFEWANRRRWVVPSHVRWEHKVSEWITAPLLETSKADAVGPRKRSHKMKSKRKSKGTSSSAAAALEQASTGDDPRVEEEEPEARLIIEGQGFKIFQKGEEKVLINYERKNCKYIGCSCYPSTDPTSCGCGDLRVAGDKTPVKHRKNCPNRTLVSLVKETSHGIVPVQREMEEKCGKEKIKDESVGKCATSKEEGEASSTKLKKVGMDAHEPHHNKPDSARKINLSGKDLRHKSRAHVLEASLRNILGSECKDGDEGSPTDNKYLSVPCPALDQPVGYFGPCICGQGCPYPPQQ